MSTTSLISQPWYLLHSYQRHGGCIYSTDMPHTECILQIQSGPGLENTPLQHKCVINDKAELQNPWAATHLSSDVFCLLRSFLKAEVPIPQAPTGETCARPLGKLSINPWSVLKTSQWNSKVWPCSNWKWWDVIETGLVTKSSFGGSGGKTILLKVTIIAQSCTQVCFL